MNVLVIPEDFRHDQHILRPIIRQMFRQLGQYTAKVQICVDPLLGGSGEALKSERIAAIIRQYGTIDLFLLCVDRDGLPGRAERLRALESMAASILPARRALLAENAWQEIEVWALAGLDLPNSWDWSEVRAETSAKEVYFDEIVRQRGLAAQPNDARGVLGQEAAGRYRRIRQLCPEDVLNLETRIGAWLERNG